MNQLYANLVFYPTLLWNMLLGRVLGVRNWWDAVDEHVILGAYPFESDVPKLAEIGVKAVVNTCQEYAGPQTAYQQYEIDQLRVPTTDFTHPSFESIEIAVDFIETHVKRGNRVYVHCKAGRARSATVVACWLVKHYQITAQQAQELMLNARSHVNPNIAQRPVVQEFEKRNLKASE